MIIVPFLYFTALTLYWWKQHRGFDVCVYMSTLYAFVSFCAIILVFGDMVYAEGGILFDEFDLELGVIPTIFYCGLITLGILPFSLIYNRDIKRLRQPDSLVLDSICWIIILIFFINIYLVVDSTAEILSGDLSTVRADHYEGIQSPAEVKAMSMPIIFRYFLYLNSTTILALPLFFYYSCASNKSWWFKALLFSASLSVPIVGLQAADRTEFTFYGMMFFFCLIFFWKFLSRKFKRGLIAIGTPMVLIVLLYLAAVSQARFAKNDDNEKAYESALQYAGQSYLNFCFFWEHGRFEYISPEREFPLTYHTLFKIDSNPERRGERSGQQGFFMSVFASYSGDIMLDLSPVGALLWSITFFILCLSIIRFEHREEYDAGDVVAIFVIAAVPVFGIFYYRYYSFAHSFMFATTALIYLFQKKPIVYK